MSKTTRKRRNWNIGIDRHWRSSWLRGFRDRLVQMENWSWGFWNNVSSFLFGAILNNFLLSPDACARDGKFLEMSWTGFQSFRDDFSDAAVFISSWMTCWRSQDSWNEYILGIVVSGLLSKFSLKFLTRRFILGFPSRSNQQLCDCRVLAAVLIRPST